MIESIQIRNVASYDESGVELFDLKKINFIYGANGSGKTTISNYLYKQTEPKFADSNHNWKGGEELKILVYNKQFREDNFSNGKINGVFTLGQATKEQKEIIDAKVEELKELKKDRNKRKETLEGKIKELAKREDSFKETVWKAIYKRFETSFKEAFVGSQRKETFKSKLLEEYVNNKSNLESFEVLNKKAETIFGSSPERIEELHTINFERIIEIENDVIWSKKVIGKADVDIAQLIDRLNINDWVNQGKTLLKETGEICPFCQQKTVTPEFIDKLEKYFDENFIREVARIKTLREEYLQLASSLVYLLNDIEGQQKQKAKSKLNLELFSSELKTLISLFGENKELLLNKTKETSRSIHLTEVKSQLEAIKGLLDDANREIKTHNKLVDNYSKERENLINAVWKYILNENEATLKSFSSERLILQKAISGIKNGFEEQRKKVFELDVEIKELTKNVTSVQPSVDSINSTLEFYGFLNFKIVPAEEEDNSYRIKRKNGELAEHTLSEGEITFITFLYFLQLVKGATDKESLSEDRVVIIDDPISSLDSNVLYIVSSLTKELIKNIKKDAISAKQLILMTHNVFFHKEVSFVDGKKNGDDKTNFWILRKRDTITSAQAFEKENPIHTSYELLWKEIRDNESIISIQNTMRRIIEHYFRILGKYGDDKLINQFDIAEEQEICRALLTWINDGSHSINDPLFVEYQDDVIEKYRKVFKEIFVKTNHEAHYNMMMGVENNEC